MIPKKTPASVVIPTALVLAHALFLVALPAQPTPPSSPAALEPEDEEIVTLEEFQVKGSASLRDDYIASEAISGTRTGEKIVDLPFTVAVLTDTFLEDFQLLTDYEQLMYFPNYAPDDNGRLRGFKPLKLRDGFSRAGPSEISNTRQIEAIMGPQSMLYGQTSPGGIVNYISKKPRMKQRNSVTAAVGGYDYKRYEFDSTGPLIPGKLFYLLNVFHRQSGSMTDFVLQKVTSYNLAITAKFTPNTALTVSWEQQFRTGNTDAAIPLLMVDSRAATSDSTVVPFARAGNTSAGSTPTYTVGPYMDIAGFNRLGPYQDNYSYFDNLNVLLEHRFNRNFSGRLSFQRYTKSSDDNRWTSGLQYVQWSEASTNSSVRTADINAYNNSSYQPEGWLTERQPMIQNQEIVTTAIQADFLTRFMTGKVKHSLLTAVDYSWDDYQDNQWRLHTSRTYSDFILSDLPIETRFPDPYNPVWYNVDYSKVTRRTSWLDRHFENGGITASYRMFLLDDRLILMAGGRYSTVKSDITTRAFSNGIMSSITKGHGTESEPTYSVGASYKLAGNGLVLYASYSTSFEPTVTVDRGLGKAQESERGKGGEFGVKGTFWNDRIGYTTSIFEITKFNVSTPNELYDSSLAGSGIPEYFTAGKVRVRGAELILSASLTKALTLVGVIGYLDSKILHSEIQGDIGDTFTQTPPMSGALTARYRFTKGWLKGLRTGMSYTYTGPRFITLGHSTDSVKAARQQIPSMDMVNAFASYEWRLTKRVRNSISLNVSNLLDVDYITASNKPGTGRSFNMTYRVTF